jgi:formyl-CoA transferase
VKSSLLQAQLFMLDFQAARWLMRGEVAKQAGNNHPTSIPTGVYKTRDGYLNLAVSGTKIWTRLCEAIGAPRLAHPCRLLDQRAALQEPRQAARRARDLFHQTRYRRLDRDPEPGRRALGADLLDRPGVRRPAGEDLGMVQKVGDVPYLGQPVTLSRTPSHAYAHPPEAGRAHGFGVT